MGVVHRAQQRFLLVIAAVMLTMGLSARSLLVELVAIFEAATGSCRRAGGRCRRLAREMER